MLVNRNFRIAKYMKKYLITLIFLIFLFTIILTIYIPLPRIIMKIYYWIKPEEGVFCHYVESKDSLPDISRVTPKEGKSIFFHETSCNSFIDGKITITSRQACAVESAARMNPDYDVYLLYASPGNYVFENTQSDRLLKELMGYQNINILHVDVNKYFIGSPVENLWKEGRMKDSQFAQSHTSDVLRFLTLWKYGEIYLDLDVIVIKNLQDLGTDFSGVESNTSVAAGILSFNYTGIGHEYATTCLEDLKNNFKGNDWGWNGPGTITRLLKNLCEVNTVAEMTGKTCRGFKIHSPHEFYVVPWWNWRWFFQPDSLNIMKAYTNNSHIIHVWNKFSTSTKIPLQAEGVPYLEFAKKFCPNVKTYQISHFSKSYSDSSGQTPVMVLEFKGNGFGNFKFAKYYGNVINVLSSILGLLY